MEKVAKNGRKVKAIALLFSFLPLFQKLKNRLKMDEKLYYFFEKLEKSAKNGRKVKAIALLFCCFLPIYEKWKKSLKMDEKLRL